MLGPPEVMGVQSIDVDHFQIRVVANTLPGKQFDVGRILRARIAAALRHEGINLPPTIDTADPTATDPISAGPAGLVRPGSAGTRPARTGPTYAAAGVAAATGAGTDLDLDPDRGLPGRAGRLRLVRAAKHIRDRRQHHRADDGAVLGEAEADPDHLAATTTPPPDRKATPTTSPSSSASARLSAPPAPSPTADPAPSAVGSPLP